MIEIRDAVVPGEVTAELPPGFALLRSEARAEGFAFLNRLAADWETGAIRFTEPGEALLVAQCGGVPAAIGGLTHDPVLPDTLRMRRFYVRAAFRRRGIGRRLAEALLRRAAESNRPVVINAGRGSEKFWEALGFVPQTRDGHTHILSRRSPS